MPRRQTENERNVPLWLIPQVILQGIKKSGEELEWIRVRRTNHRYYTVSIRTRPTKREFYRRDRAAATGRQA